MTTGGWIFMIVVWVLILCLVGYCLWKTLSLEREHLSAPLEIEDEDLGTDGD